MHSPNSHMVSEPSKQEAYRVDQGFTMRADPKCKIRMDAKDI